MRGVLVFVSFFVVLGNCFPNTPKNELPQEKLIGVDNYILPTDTLVLMNHLLIDVQLDYDFAIESRDIPSIMIALHQKALVYLKLNELELATNYAWRLFNLSNKYDLNEGKLYSYALLVRINQAKGNRDKESYFYNEYRVAIRDFDTGVIAKPIEIGFPQDETILKKEPLHENTLGKNSQKHVLEDVPENEAGFYGNKQYGLAVLIIGFVLLTFLFFDSKRNSNTQLILVNKVIPPTNQIQLSSHIKVKNKPLEFKAGENHPPQEFNIKEKVSVINKTKSMTEVGGNSAFKLDEQSSKVSNGLTADLIRSKRGSDFYKKTEIHQTPLWVSGIEHHLKGMNAYNGIRFDFNYSGDFNNVSENTQNIITNFMTSLAETLVDASNIQSVSSQLVNSNDGLVAMLVARPLVSSRPVLDVITISSIRKVFSGSNKYRVSTNNVPGGLLKVVLKHSVKEYNLVS